MLGACALQCLSDFMTHSWPFNRKAIARAPAPNLVLCVLGHDAAKHNRSKQRARAGVIVNVHGPA